MSYYVATDLETKETVWIHSETQRRYYAWQSAARERQLAYQNGETSYVNFSVKF